MIPRRRGVKSPRNQRDSVEKTQNHLENSWSPQEMEWREEKTVRVLGGRSTPLYRLETQDPDMSGPGAGYVWSKLPWQFQKLWKLPKKLIFKGSWRRANRRYIYIYVANGQVLTNKYIYIRLGTIQIVKHE
jgi:hypothetical protein